MNPVSSVNSSGSTIRAAFVAPGNPRRIGLLSGSPYHALRALEQHFDMALVIEDPWPSWLEEARRAFKPGSDKIFDHIWSPRIILWHRYTALMAKRTIARLRAAKPDVVFTFKFCQMAHLLADEFRVVNISDATVHAMLNYYDAFTRLTDAARSNMESAETVTIKRSMLSLYPSRWACESALKDYGATTEQVREIAWGANIDPVQTQPRKLSKGELRFLFVGIDWDRKGGRIALDTVAELNRRGFDSRLDVVGCTAKALKAPAPQNVVFHGFLKKSAPEDAARLYRLYTEATFLLLPTKAECFGQSILEAAHHGLPSMSYSTGGLPSVISTGKTGILLPPGAPASKFADAICDLLASPEHYAAMSLAVLKDARNRFTWKNWANEVETEVLKCLMRSGASGT